MQFKLKTYDTDKSEQYMEQYLEHFEKLRDKQISLLELGVHKGGSLLMWGDYFSNGSIAGVDIKNVQFDNDNDRVKFYQGSQTDTDLLSRIKKEIAPTGFDIIIDDASHTGENTFISFVYLFTQCLKRGGIYVIEDWGTGYWAEYPDGKSARLSHRHVSHHLHNTTNYQPSKSFMTDAKRFTSHDYGMVGMVKQLIDEVGFLDLTNPKRTSYDTSVNPTISKIVYSHGQVIIYKSL
jgi:23S rRNA U2552 (ribose-2'-O)-methylase RlmE/FtsJ